MAVGEVRIRKGTLFLGGPRLTLALRGWRPAAAGPPHRSVVSLARTGVDRVPVGSICNTILSPFTLRRGAWGPAARSCRLPAPGLGKAESSRALACL